MEPITITYKTGSGSTLHRHKPLNFATRALARDIQSIRLPVSYKDQRHLPGHLWMSRMRSFVAYESRLEMTILLQLDFNQHVAHVVSQPFLLHYDWQSKRYQHTPDFLVQYSDGGAEVINVKPRQFVQAQRNVRAFKACEAAAIEMGFAYSTRSEIDGNYLANLKWLAAYRRPPANVHQYRLTLIEIAEEWVPINVVLKATAGFPVFVRPVLFHLIWAGELIIDMHKRMTDETSIRASLHVRKS